MVSRKIFLEISVHIIILLVIQQKTEASRQEQSNLLSLLTEKLNLHKQPVIIIVGKERVTDLGLSAEVTGDNRAANLIHHLLGHDKLESKLVHHKKSTRKPFIRDDRKRQKYRSQRIREEGRGLQKEDRNVLRSPIVKKLLRISNSLRCEAKDECQDKCSNKFLGNKAKKCHVQCEIKYICEEEEEDKDPCEEEGCADSCGQSGECKSMSTKGEKLVTDEPGCVRC